MAYFQLQPAEMELQELAEQYWQRPAKENGSLRRPHLKPEKRSEAANIRWPTWKRSFAGSRNGWFIT